MADDDFDGFEFFEISPQDLDRIDSEVAATLLEHEQLQRLRSWAQDGGGPTLQIQAEVNSKLNRSPQEEQKGSLQLESDSSGGSPYARYRRRRKVLSVTDLTSLSWCVTNA
jgi:hypothetical protein